MQRWYKQCVHYVLYHAADKTGGKPKATIPTGNAYKYRTVQERKWPCTCKYVYSGITEQYTFLQYGHRNQAIFNKENLPMAGTPCSPDEAANWINTLIDGLGRDLLRKIGHDQRDSHLLPDYVVANEYQDSSRCIGEHTDSHPLFGGNDNETVIFSFNISRDGIFCLKPGSIDNEFGRFVGMTKGTMNDWVVPVYAPENSVIIMGGYCQRECKHYTLSHDDVLAGRAPELQGRLGQKVRDEYLAAQRYCLESSPRQAWNLKHVALVAPQM